MCKVSYKGIYVYGEGRVGVCTVGVFASNIASMGLAGYWGESCSRRLPSVFFPLSLSLMPSGVCSNSKLFVEGYQFFELPFQKEPQNWDVESH